MLNSSHVFCWKNLRNHYPLFFTPKRKDFCEQSLGILQAVIAARFVLPSHAQYVGFKQYLNFSSKF